MRVLDSMGHILTGMAGFALLTGVSAADSLRSAGVVMPRQPILSRPDDSMPHRFAVPGIKIAFVSDTNTFVYLFDKMGSQIGAISGFEFPTGLAVDTSDKLYVADEFGRSISILPPPYTGTRTQLNDPHPPFGVAVDANGNVAAVNFDGTVSLYTKGAASPTNYAYNSAFAYGYNGAFDAQGNLYVQGKNSSGQSLVGIIVGGVKGTTISLLTAKNGIANVAGIQVTTRGRIAILEGSIVDTYNPPNQKTGSLGEPIAQTNLANVTRARDFVFTANNTFAVVADSGNCPPEGCSVDPAAELYAYPAGGQSIESRILNQGDDGNYPDAAAVSPPEIP